MVYRTPVLVVICAILAVPALAFARIDTSLDRGDRNTDVTELQTFLASDSALYPEGLVTGYFGPLTEAAVQRFQCRADIVCEGTPETTGYGRVGPLTQNALNAQLENGSGIDMSAPIISSAAIATTSTEISIGWTTNEPAQSRVMYSTTWPFRYAAAPDVEDTSLDVNSGVTVTGLTPDTSYYVVRESVDEAGNVMWTTAHTIRTGSTQ